MKIENCFLLYLQFLFFYYIYNLLFYRPKSRIKKILNSNINNINVPACKTILLGFKIINTINAHTHSHTPRKIAKMQNSVLSALCVCFNKCSSANGFIKHQRCDLKERLFFFRKLINFLNKPTVLHLHISLFRIF